MPALCISENSFMLICNQGNEQTYIEKQLISIIKISIKFAVKFPAHRVYLVVNVDNNIPKRVKIALSQLKNRNYNRMWPSKGSECIIKYTIYPLY